MSLTSDNGQGPASWPRVSVVVSHPFPHMTREGWAPTFICRARVGHVAVLNLILRNLKCSCVELTLPLKMVLPKARLAQASLDSLVPHRMVR